jgi:Uma2 family endonuclease
MRVLSIDSSPHEFTIAEYMKLDLDVRTELIEGVIYDMSPRGDDHRYAVTALSRELQLALPTYAIQVQDMVAIPNWQGRSAPEPDIAVISIAARARPSATDTFAIIEVSDTTYARDRKKVSLYLESAIPSWIVNIKAKRVESYVTPADLEPGAARSYAIGDTFDVLGTSINVTDLFQPD